MALFGRFSLGKKKSGAIRDAAACAAWLTTLGRSDEALASIAEFLIEGAQDTLALGVQMEILDQVRVLVFAELCGRVDHAEFRALPLSTADTASVWGVVDTTNALRDAYQRLALRHTDPVSGATPDPAARLTALHRALDLHGHLITLYLSVCMAVPAGIWDQHCRMGQLVRELDGQDNPQDDALNATVSATCREAFVAPVLLALADPAALSQTEFRLVRALARKYAGKVGFRIDPLANPTARAAARPVINPGAVLRLGEHLVRFDSQRVRPSFDSRIEALDAGKSPAQIGFGDRLSAAASRALLVRLIRLWGPLTTDAIDAPEHQWRKPGHDQALAILGMPGQRESASQRPSSLPVSGTYSYERHRRDGLTRSQQEIERDRLADLLAQGETWQLSGEVADTLLCTRTQLRPRVSINQLVALKPGGKSGNTPLLLGVVQGLQQTLEPDDEGRMRPAVAHLLRVRLLTGLPLLVNASSEGADIECAFLLVTAPPGSAPDLSTDQIWERVRAAPQQYSLILPLANYRPQRAVRAAAGGGVANLQCEELLLRGLDFDQVSFSIA